MAALSPNERLERCETLDQLTKCLLEVLREFGYTQFSYIPLDPPKGGKLREVQLTNGPADRVVPQFVTTFPEAWVEHYLGNDYSNIDPTFHHATETLHPFHWDEIAGDQGFSAQLRQFFDEAAEFGVRSGVTIPLHGPRNGMATLNLARSDDAPLDEEAWETQQVQLTRIALIVHQKMLSFLEAESAEPDSKLTSRERECLLWTSRGKTNWEVGEILSISHETVRYHLKNAMAKMGVYSQHHAAVRAILNNEIFP